MIRVPGGALHAAVGGAVIVCPSGRAIQRRLSAPSDHSSLVRSNGTRPGCGVARPAAIAKHPVADSVAVLPVNAQPAIEPRAPGTGGVLGPFHSAARTAVALLAPGICSPH